MTGCAFIPSKPAVQSAPRASRVALIEPQFHDCALPSREALTADLTIAAACYDLPLKDNARVQRWIGIYTTSQRETTEHRLKISGRYLYDMRTELAVSGLPEDLSYVPMALTGFETGGTGPWMISARTAAAHAKGPSFWTDPRRDVMQSTRMAAVEMSNLHDKYHDWHLAIAAYTAGSGAVDAAIRKSGSRDYWKLAGYLPRSRRDDVPKVLAMALIAKHPDRFGFDGIAYAPQLRTDAITVRQATSLADIANLAGVRLADLEALNPALTRGCTPPGVVWDIQLPRGTSDPVIDGLWDLSRTFTCDTHTVQRGETLSRIASAYGMSATHLQQMNHISNPRGLEVGTRLSVRKKVVIEDPRDQPFKKENLPEPMIDPEGTKPSS